MYELRVTGCQGVDVDPFGYEVRLFLESPAHPLVAALIDSWPHRGAAMSKISMDNDDSVVVICVDDPTMAVQATKWFVETAAPEITAKAMALDAARAEAETQVREHLEYKAT